MFIDPEMLDQWFKEGSEYGSPIEFAIFDKRVLLSLGIQKELCIPGGRWWVDDIHTPLFSVWKPLELRFAPAHRLLGPLHARLIRGGHPLYNRMAPVPCHGTGQR